MFRGVGSRASALLAVAVGGCWGCSTPAAHDAGLADASLDAATFDAGDGERMDAGGRDAGDSGAVGTLCGASTCDAGPLCTATTGCDAGQLCMPGGCVRSPRVLVVTVPDLTNGTWHHAHAVPVAVAMIQSYPGLSVQVSSDPQALLDLDPSQFDVLVFPAVGPWQFTSASLGAVARFVSAGKGFVGIHNAADTANFALGGGIDPVWYRDNLLGGLYWSGFPWLEDTIHRADTRHPSTTAASMSWSDSPPFEDELYAFQPLPANKLHLLLTVNTPPIAVDPAGDQYDGGYVVPHPSSFCRQNIGSGGRSWFTALGHMSGAPGEPGNTYAMPWFQDHVYQGILWAAGVTAGDCPDDNPALAAP